MCYKCLVQIGNSMHSVNLQYTAIDNHLSDIGIDFKSDNKFIVGNPTHDARLKEFKALGDEFFEFAKTIADVKNMTPDENGKFEEISDRIHQFRQELVGDVVVSLEEYVYDLGMSFSEYMKDAIRTGDPQGVTMRNAIKFAEATKDMLRPEFAAAIVETEESIDKAKRANENPNYQEFIEAMFNVVAIGVANTDTIILGEFA